MEVKETLQILLDHGGEFINTDCETPFDSFLPHLLDCQKWTVESIRLLIRRGANPGLDVQPWGSCLPLAIYGSSEESREGIRDALILLINNGADVYAKNKFGHSATDIAYKARTKSVYNGEWYKFDSWTMRDMWREVLAACGYDAEEVVRRSLEAGVDAYVVVSDGADGVDVGVQVAELSDSDGNMDEDAYDISEDEDGDNDSYADVDEDEDDYDISEDEHEHNSVLCEICSFRDESRDDGLPKQTGSVVRGQFDWSLLEDDTNVWKE